MTFRVGQKVVFIGDVSDSFVCTIHNIAVPQKNAVYTIRGIFEWNAKSGLWLEEIRNRPQPLSDGSIGEPGFWAGHFRPLIERKSQTDISFALDILDRINGKVSERV